VGRQYHDAKTVHESAAPGRTRRQSYTLPSGAHYSPPKPDEDNVFSTPGWPVMRGVLARSLSAVVASPQQVGIEKEEERRQEAEGLGAGVRSYLCSSPRPPSWPLQVRSRVSRGRVAFLLSFLRLFLCHCLGALYHFGTHLGGGQRGACNGPPGD